MDRAPLHIIKPDSHEWPECAYGFAAGPDYAADAPAAVVLCRDTADVQAALHYANENGLPFRVRG